MAKRVKKLEDKEIKWCKEIEAQIDEYLEKLNHIDAAPYGRPTQEKQKKYLAYIKRRVKSLDDSELVIKKANELVDKYVSQEKEELLKLLRESSNFQENEQSILGEIDNIQKRIKNNIQPIITKTPYSGLSNDAKEKEELIEYLGYLRSDIRHLNTLIQKEEEYEKLRKQIQQKLQAYAEAINNMI